MENNIDTRIGQLEEKMDKVYKSVEKIRKYFLWTGIITVAVIVIPIIGLMFAIPAFMKNYIGGLNDATGGAQNLQNLQNLGNIQDLQNLLK
jgi:type III secretory pathway component EscT